MKPMWYSMEVDYGFFDPTRFYHTKTWKFIRALLMLICLPIIARFMIGWMKRMNYRLKKREEQKEKEKKAIMEPKI
jgi:hypothetical protein